MAKDIKTRKTQPKTIKTLKGTVKTLDRSFRAERNVKEMLGAAMADETAENAPANAIEVAEARTAQYAGRKAVQGGKRSVRSALQVKQRTAAAKQSIKAVKPTVKAVGSTVKTEIKSVKTSVKTAKNMIKTANATVKTGTASAKGSAAIARASYTGTKAVAQASYTAVKVTLQAVISAVKVTASAAVASTEAIGAFIAAGGWIILLLLLFVVLIGVLFNSALGIHFADEMNTGSLTAVRQELNLSFSEELNAQKAQLQGYDRIVVRPAPSITKWNEILAVYSVRAQMQNLAPIEMTEQSKALLRETMWDMISFSASSETVTSVETDEAGNSVIVTEVYGIVTILYKTTDEMAKAYHFSDDDKEMLSAVLSMYSDFGGISVGGTGNGKMINPCPDGRFNGNDYPAYAGSGEYHAGRDIACPIGTSIYAAADGIVIHVNDQGESYGNHIMIAHGDEIYTLYAHCDSLLVSVGQEVKQGQQIAWSGATGNVTGPHLHFEVRVGGSKFRVNNVDPLDWIS